IERGVARPIAAQTPRNAALAQSAAEEATVLLKNSGVLPLPASIKSLAVIGPNADVVRIQGGGSSAVVPFQTSTPLAALKAALAGVQDDHAEGVDNEETPPAASPELCSPGHDRSVAGLSATYYAGADMTGEPVKRETATSVLKRISGNIAGP